MSVRSQSSLSTPESLQALYAPIREELEGVEELLRRELQCDFPFIDKLMKHGFRLGGKRLRPALVLLCGKACGGIRPEHLTMGAVVEMIHTATLVHDDVLDEATLRRHLETVNARWDNETSILLGDYLYARAICLASSLDDMTACRILADATRTTCEGELRQVATRGCFDLTEKDYLEIIAAKTAALCEASCRLGARCAGADDSVTALCGEFGRLLGVAFQVIDDVLDVRGVEAVAGKSLGTDLEKKKPTLPLIRLLNQSSEADRAAILETLSQSNGHLARDMQPWFQRTDAVAYAMDQAVRYSQQAKQVLDRLPASLARDTLCGLADFVISRQQ